MDLLQREYPDVPLRALVRDEDKASRLRSRYPNVETVTGDLESLALLEEEARGADVVVNCAPDITYDRGIGAVLAGLKDTSLRRRRDIGGGGGGGDGNGEQKGFYIHTSGAATFFGEPTGLRDDDEGARVWDDVADIQDIIHVEPSRTHVATDNLVRSAHPAVHIAVISPSGITGISPSAEYPVPLTAAVLDVTARAFGSGFQIARGENESSWVHVMDLARAFMVLVRDALDALSAPPGTSLSSSSSPSAGFPLWGPEAYYFASGEDVSFHDLQEAVVPVLYGHGVISSREVRSVTHVEAARTCLAGGTGYDPDAPPPPPDSWVVHLATWFGVNMRVRPSRLLALGWRPEERSILKAWEEAFAVYLGRLGEGKEKKAKDSPA